MNPQVIIEQLDTVEDGCSGTFPIQEIGLMNEFVLQIRDEAFSHRVIIALPFDSVVRIDMGADSNRF